MEDRELIEDLYSIKRPWFVSRVVVNTAENRLDAHLDHEGECTWKRYEYGKEYPVLDYMKGNRSVIETFKSSSPLVYLGSNGRIQFIRSIPES